MEYILLIILTYFGGHYLVPFVAYCFDCRIDYAFIGILVAIAVFGIVSLIVALFRKEGYNYFFLALCAFLAMGCNEHYIKMKFDIYDTYVGEYIEFIDKNASAFNIEEDNNRGLLNKYGIEVIKPCFSYIVQIFSNQERQVLFLAVKSYKAKDERMEGSTFDVYIYDDKFNLCKTQRITKSNKKWLVEHIEQNFGSILQDFTFTYDHTNRSFIQRLKETQQETQLHVENDEQEKNAQNDDDLEKEKNKISPHEEKPVSNQVSGPEYGQRDVWVDCMNCMGSGKCPSCHGNGWCVSTWSDGSYNDTYKCPVCHGAGRCQMCYGTKGHYEKQVYQIR